MRALIKRDPVEGFEFDENCHIDEPVGDECQIKVTAVSVCGSDINLWKWNDVARTIAALPFIPGHEAVGIVVKCGPEATHKLGQRVAVENHFYCENCVMCDQGRGDICNKMKQYGHGKGTTQGGCSELSNVSSKYLYPLNSSITDEQACLIEPMGVAHNILERIDIVDQDILIIGCGPVGLLAIACARGMGAKKIYAADVIPEKLELAEKMGADKVIDVTKADLHETIMKATNGDGIARICEISGHAPTLAKCLKYLRKGGKLGLVGLPKSAVTFEDPLPDLIFKSLEIHSVHGRKIFHTWEECEKLIESGRVKPEMTVSHRVPLSDFKTAYDALLSGKACKIIMNPQA